MPHRIGNIWYPKVAVRENVEAAVMWVSGLIYDKFGNRIFHPDKKLITPKERYLAEHFDEEVDIALYELETRQFNFGPISTFDTLEGRKVRHINHLNKHGAILVQSVMNVCQPYFISRYIPYTYSSIKGRGLTDCVARVKKTIAEHPDWYYYKSDIYHCYESTDHQVAMNAISSLFKDIYILDFFAQLIALIEDGLAIGFSSNHYILNLILTPLDHRMVDKEGYSEGYNRFMDDEVILAPTLEDCIRADRINREELEKVKYQIKSNSVIAPVACGIDFCGYKMFPDHTLLRKSIKLNMQKKHRLLIENNVSDFIYKQEMASFYGWCQHANCAHLLFTVMGDRLHLFDKHKAYKNYRKAQLEEILHQRQIQGIYNIINDGLPF